MIIKFNPYQTTNQKYNDLLRGRYAWLVRGIKVIPLDQVSLEEFMMLERGVDILKEYDIFKFIDIQENIDIDATNRINNISKYLTANSLVPEGSLDVDTLKKFRTKLAEILLSSHKYGDEYDFSCYTDDSSKISNMLTYYANNMIDCAIRSLSQFIDIPSIQSINQQTSCECGLINTGSSIISSNSKTSAFVMKQSTISNAAGCGCGTTAQQVQAISACDPIDTYRSGIYKYMISVFSDVNFWILEDHYDICVWIKSAVEGIIKLNLPLASNIVDVFADCTCSNANSSEQQRLMKMLSDLATAMGYIINNEISGNRNFINTALLNWATYLYENMYWM